MAEAAATVIASLAELVIQRRSLNPYRFSYQDVSNWDNDEFSCFVKCITNIACDSKEMNLYKFSYQDYLLKEKEGVQGNGTSEETPVEGDSKNEQAEEILASESDESEEKLEIKLETAPADFRFPTTNQTRHCFTRYIEYHRCIAAKGESAPECDKFAKYYRSLCPGEWVEKWNEQRNNGTFAGPL